MKQGIVIVDLGFGDSGKGTMTDWLCRDRKADLVVRFSGGAQAAHNVVLEDGTHHTFSSFGSGTLAGVRTHLSRYFMLDPSALLCEAEVLRAKGYGWALSSLTVDHSAVIVAPWHKIANKMREIARGAKRHGSVGMGIGEARMDQLNGVFITTGNSRYDRSFRDILTHQLSRKIKEMSVFKEAAPELFSEMQAVNIEGFSEICRLAVRDLASDESVIGDSGMVMMEGSQGVLLDETYGFAPYNTWTDTTSRNALSLLGKDREIERVGVLRTYFTRHGAGPFPTEGKVSVLEPHNATHEFMGQFRTGAFDCELARYAINCCDGIDSLALTHMDRIPTYQVADEYGPITTSAARLYAAQPKYFRADPFIQTIEERLGVEVRYTSHGPAASHKLACGVPAYK